MIYITRREQFCAAHKLYRKEWSDEKNLDVFGKCANSNGHGHNYDLFVTVKGESNPETGFLINLYKVSEIIQREVVDKIDHKNINLDVKFMQNIIPTTENLAIKIWDLLMPHFRSIGCELHCIKLQETGKNHVEYFGP